MNTIDMYDLQDELKERGFIYLTSEADSTGLRGLYDLTENAVNLLERFTGGMTANRKDYNGRGAIASVFLPRSNEYLTALLIFCLFSEDDSLVIFECYRKDESERGIRDSLRVFTRDEYNEQTELNRENPTINTMVKRLREYYSYRVHMLSGTGPRRGLSNVHAFTGRSQ